jgi:hypothetical protein
MSFYCTVSGVRDRVQGLTDSVMDAATVSGNILRGSAEVDTWCRPFFEVPFSAVDAIVEYVSEALAGAYCLEAYTGGYLGNSNELAGTLRDWAYRQLEFVTDNPERLTETNHPMVDGTDADNRNRIKYWLPQEEPIIDITKSEVEWRFRSSSKQSD